MNKPVITYWVLADEARPSEMLKMIGSVTHRAQNDKAKMTRILVLPKRKNPGDQK